MPSDLKEMLKERAQAYPVLPDVKMKIKGTVSDGSYPRRVATNRGVVRNRARNNVRAPPDEENAHEEHVDQAVEVEAPAVEVEVEAPVEAQDEAQVEVDVPASDAEPHAQVTVANDAGSGRMSSGVC